MNLRSDSSNPHRRDHNSDFIWNKLYTFLPPRVKLWVHFSHVSSWRGQEEDIVDDIVQETITRTLKYARRAQRGEVPAITSLEGLSIVIARNYLEDLRRRDYRLVRFQQDNPASEVHTQARYHVDLSETAFDNVFLEWVYVKFSIETVKFSQKQRTALLIDLANRMHFDDQPTPLQQAFLAQGIRLQDYQRPLPTDPVKRSRHAANVSLAYRRTRNWARDNIPSC